jgi:hypothetical protein
LSEAAETRWPVETRLLVVSSWALMLLSVVSAVIAALLVSRLVMSRVSGLVNRLVEVDSGLAPV